MNPPYAYAEAKSALVDILTREAAVYEFGHYGELGADFDVVDPRLPRNGGPEFGKLLLALEFWSGWLDRLNTTGSSTSQFTKATGPNWPELSRVTWRMIESQLILCCSNTSLQDLQGHLYFLEFALCLRERTDGQLNSRADLREKPPRPLTFTLAAHGSQTTALC